MEQYIPKSAVVAEIKRHISIAESQLALFGNEDERNRIIWAQQKKVCEIILSFLDTIEVKEVDLKEEIDKIWKARFSLGWDDKSLLSVSYKGFESIAKHFFELGLKAQKGE